MADLTGLRIDGGLVGLRPLEAGDEAGFADLFESSAEFWAPWTPAPTRPIPVRERFRRERMRAELGAAAGTHVRLGGFLADGSLVGLFALNEVVRGVFQSAHASWQVGAQWTGRGFGTDGVRALLALAFADEPRGAGLHRVQANIMPGNTASLRVAEKVGFRKEGLAERYLRIAGRWADHVMLAMTVEEWRDRS